MIIEDSKHFPEYRTPAMNKYRVFLGTSSRQTGQFHKNNGERFSPLILGSRFRFFTTEHSTRLSQNNLIFCDVGNKVFQEEGWQLIGGHGLAVEETLKLIASEAGQ